MVFQQHEGPNSSRDEEDPKPEVLYSNKAFQEIFTCNNEEAFRAEVLKLNQQEEKPSQPGPQAREKLYSI